MSTRKFRNGGIGTYYRRLAEQLTAEGWHVILLLTWTEKGFGGESELAAVKHIFSTFETEQVLNLQPLHLRMRSMRTRLRELDLWPSSVASFLPKPFSTASDFARLHGVPRNNGNGISQHSRQQAGFLGHKCMTAVTMHGCHEWVYEASEKHQQECPAWLWQAAYYDTFAFENADLSFPSHFLKAKVESYGWNTLPGHSHALLRASAGFDRFQS